MVHGGALTGDDDSTDDSSFLRVVCHELGTPVASVRALARALGHRSSLSPDQRDEAVRLIEDHAQHMAAMLEAVRAVADHLPDQVRTAPAIDLAVVVRGAAHAAGVERLEADITPVVAVVTVDASALRRILTNLLANAQEHGRPPIELRADRRRHALRIVVADHGDGMPAHLSADAFRAGTPVGDGQRGLGLWIVTQLVTMLGGHVRVLEVPAGTRIEVVVPLGG